MRKTTKQRQQSKGGKRAQPGARVARSLGGRLRAKTGKRKK